MICPSDNDILEQTFSAYNLGYIAHNEKEAVDQLTQLFNAYLHPGDITIKANEQYVNQFSRKHQTTVLADILRKM